MQIHSKAYEKAFVHYLRRGTPLDVFLKSDAAAHPTTHYIWMTAEDDKVRPSHAANHGKIFAWDNPPATGHPGVERHCRCTAVPYYQPDPSKIDDPPIEPVYPEFYLAPLLGAGRLVTAWRAARTLQRSNANPTTNTSDNLTDHGALRAAQRNISQLEADAAIQSAKDTGNMSTQMGKYGTPQIRYKGENGVTVIVETEGRNAGKIITFWRHK